MVRIALLPLDLEDLEVIFGALELAVANDIRMYYHTICPECLEIWVNAHNRSYAEVEGEIFNRITQGEELSTLFNEYRFDDPPVKEGLSENIFAEVIYYFWAKEVTCKHCGHIIRLFKSYMFAHKRRGAGHSVTTCYALPVKIFS